MVAVREGRVRYPSLRPAPRLRDLDAAPTRLGELQTLLPRDAQEQPRSATVSPGDECSIECKFFNECKW